MATSGVCDSSKVEVLQGGHCFNASLAISATTHTNTTLDGLSSTAGISVGMAVSGTNIAAGAVVASVDSASQVTLSKASTGSATNTMTFAGDTFKILLIKTSPSHTFNRGSTNVGTPGSGTPSATNVGTDEVSGSATVRAG